MFEVIITHKRTDIENADYTEVPAPPHDGSPSLAILRRYKAHAAFRLSEDGFWHYFRLTDADKAAERDKDLSGPLL